MNQQIEHVMVNISHSLESINSKLERIAETLEGNLGFEQTVNLKFDVEAHNLLSCTLGNIYDAINELKGKKNG